MREGMYGTVSTVVGTDSNYYYCKLLIEEVIMAMVYSSNSTVQYQVASLEGEGVSERGRGEGRGLKGDDC